MMPSMLRYWDGKNATDDPKEKIIKDAGKKVLADYVRVRVMLKE